MDINSYYRLRVYKRFSEKKDFIPILYRISNPVRTPYMRRLLAKKKKNYQIVYATVTTTIKALNLKDNIPE